MSRNWVATHIPYEIDNGVVKTEGVHYKVTGTFLGGLLGMSPYETPFSITSKLIGAWDDDISNEPPVKTGKLLEDRIIDYAIAKHSDIGTIFKAILSVPVMARVYPLQRPRMSLFTPILL